MAGMKNFLQRKVTKKQDFDEEESKGNSISANSIDQPQAIGDMYSGIEKRKNELRIAMGDDVFQYYYDYLYKHRNDPSTDEAKLRSELNSMMGTNKQLKNLMFDLEQIIF